MSEPITNAADAVRALGALPMPVGPEPQKPRPIAYAAKNTDLLLADAAERSRAAEWPWDMWCRICHVRPTSHRTEAEALEAADRHVKLQHAPQAEVHKLMAAGGLSELERLKARVAELEAERHSTNEALDDAVQALRASREDGPATDTLPAWLHWRFGKHGQRWDSLDVDDQSYWEHHAEAVRRAVARNGFKPGGNDAALALGASVAKSADKLTALFAPTQALREVPDGEHAAIVHHNYRVGRDLPETGGAR